MESIGSSRRSKELGLGGLTCVLRPVCLGICGLPSILEGCAWRTMESGLGSIWEKEHVMHSAEMEAGGWSGGLHHWESQTQNDQRYM